MSITDQLVFVDCETTSLSDDRRPWEIALIRDGHELSFCIAYDDLALDDADPRSLDVGRFWKRHPQATSIRNGMHPTLDVACASFYDDEGSTKHLPGIMDEFGGGDPFLVDARLAAHLVACMTYGRHLAGVNPSFDEVTLTGLLRREGLCPAWNYHTVDVAQWALGRLAAGGDVRVPWRSDDIGDAFGVEPPSEGERHTALGDAKWAARMWAAVTS